MAERVVLGFRTELVDHDHDHWCNTCMLGTGIRAVMAVILGERMHTQTSLWCLECGGRDVTVTDAPTRNCP